MSHNTQSYWQIYDQAGQRKYINSAERERFLKAADREPLHVTALCYLLCFTGCRISEALNLTWHQLDADMHQINFQTLKRRKLHFRAVPIPANLTLMLLDLRFSDQDNFWSMHRTTAWRHIKRAMKDAGIVGPMATCKGMRHGFGVRCVENSIPLSILQRWLGHAPGSSATAIYLNMIGKEERELAERLWT